MLKIEYVRGECCFEMNDIDEEMRNHIHFNSPTNVGFTLCGLAWDDQPAKETSKKVTCPDCISIVRSCKKIRL